MKTLSNEEIARYGQEKEEIAEEPLQEKPQTQQEKPQAQQLKTYKLGDDPSHPPHNGTIVKKSTLKILVIALIVLASFLVVNMVWLNISVSLDKFKGNSTFTSNNNINVETPEIPINVTSNTRNDYEHTINVENNLRLSENDINVIVTKITDEVLEGLNATS